MKNALKISAMSLCLLLASLATSFATLVITDFVNGGPFEDMDVDGTALFTDPASSVTGTLTTRSLTGIDGIAITTSGQGISINENSNVIGVNSPGTDTSDRFDNNEAWGFDWNVNAEFVGIDLQLFTAADAESFTLQAASWIGLGVTPGSGSVSFNNGAGSFTLTDNGSADIFDLAALSGGVTLPLPAGTVFNIGYNNTALVGTGNSSITAIEFNLIPEPSSFALLGLGAVLLIRVRKVRRQ
jgi:hypothetical protein